MVLACRGEKSDFKGLLAGFIWMRTLWASPDPRKVPRGGVTVVAVECDLSPWSATCGPRTTGVRESRRLMMLVSAKGNAGCKVI